MNAFYDSLETRDPAEREADLFSRLPSVLRAAMAAPAYAERWVVRCVLQRQLPFSLLGSRRSPRRP